MEPQGTDNPVEEQLEPSASEGSAPPQTTGGPNVQSFLEQTNIADSLDEEKLEEIGKDVYEGYKRDLESRTHWEQNLENWTKLALQVKEEKTWPWPKASNIKYPILATAAMQFSARSYPTLIPSQGNVVKAEVIGKDPDGQKKERADRVSKFMSYQLMKEMEDWDEEMDKLLLILPIVGTCFKKTYWDSVKKVNCSKLILPKDLIVNYWAASLESAERITERMQMSKRLVKERQQSGIFCDDVELHDPTRSTYIKQEKTKQLVPPQDDKTTPYIILEQHTYLDLDDDGYDEPYIVTIEENSKCVLRIVARFDHDTIYTDEQGKLQKIDPVQYYTKYDFIPNPDGGIYSVGFGLLLGPINDAVNTLVNQLVDAGTLSNLQSGFIGKGLRLRAGDNSFKPGEWKYVNATGDDIKKQIFPMPAKEPSNVLLELLGMLVTSAKELASVAEIFVGKMPGQNTPATTTMATIEQGMKVFTAIYKRVYRSLTKEFKKLYRLNRVYLDSRIEMNILDEPIGNDDFEDGRYDICPAADPQATSAQEKLVKAQGLMELLQLGTVDPHAVTMRILEAQEQPKIQELMPKGPPPPDPKVVAEQMKAQNDKMLAEHKMQMDQQKAELDARESAMKMQMQSQMMAQELEHKKSMAMLELQNKLLDHRLNMQTALQEHKMNLQTSQQEHTVQLQHQKEKSAADIAAIKSKAAAQPKKESK